MERKLTKEHREWIREEIARLEFIDDCDYMEQAFDDIDSADEEIEGLRRAFNNVSEALFRSNTTNERLRVALAKIHDGCFTFAEMKRYAWRALNDGGDND